MQQGIVYLVGAGPGDYKLISVKGLECIKSADVLIYDRLADERLLSYASRTTELIYVGKASNAHTMVQEDINELLVHKALERKTVVRLKGGDPFVFGRGGEEALALVKHNIPFEIVPGVTSAIAVPAYAGIPVTQRGVAASFAVITGHENPAKAESSIQWDKLATAVDTLVFLMGVENLPYITAKLMECGRDADTPAAVIRWGTKPEQRTIVTTVGKAATDVENARLTPPAIFIVGNVVKLRQELTWFDKKKLFGKTILVTRAREQASTLTAELEQLGAACVVAPTIAIQPLNDFVALDAAIGSIERYQWLIFTSVNGVDAFFRRLTENKLDSRSLHSIKVAAIGVPTADRLKNYGIQADIVPLEFKAEGIIAALAGFVEPGMSVLIPQAFSARDILPKKLKELGVMVETVPVYQTVMAHTDGQAVADKLEKNEIDLVTFTSSSTVTNLVKLLGADGTTLLKQCKIACIGPITAQTCRDHGIMPAVIAEEYTVKGLVAAIQAIEF